MISSQLIQLEIEQHILMERNGVSVDEQVFQNKIVLPEHLPNGSLQDGRRPEMTDASGVQFEGCQGTVVVVAPGGRHQCQVLAKTFAVRHQIQTEGLKGRIVSQRDSQMRPKVVRVDPQ